jgi:hypothetical protein
MDILKCEQDIKLGNEGEDKCLPIFREKFDKYLCKTNRYSLMDYISPTMYIELKTRNCNHDKYNDIVIGKNKVDFSFKSNKKCILAFNFQDGIYYYIVDKKDFDNGDIYYAIGGRYDRGVDERKEVAYIKRKLLIKL